MLDFICIENKLKDFLTVTFSEVNRRKHLINQTMKKVLKILKRIALAIILLILIVIVPVGIDKLYQGIRSSFLTEKEKRIEDIERLEYLLTNEFSGYSVLPGTENFNLELRELKNKIQQDTSFSKADFGLDIVKVVSAFKDPHTVVYNKDQFLKDNFPYRLKWSNGNYYILSGTINKNWLGAKVLQFDNTTFKDAFKQLSKFANSPNETGTAYFVDTFDRSSDALFYSGISTKKNEITLKLELHTGEIKDFTFKSLPKNTIKQLPDYQTISTKYKNIKKPLYRTSKPENYWYQFLKEHNIFYVRYDYCVDQGNADKFWTNVFNQLQLLKPKKFILDIRNNPGGDTNTHKVFLQKIKKDTIVNKYGSLFTLINRGTGSAAVSLASEMQKRTQSILIGEKTIDTPSTTSDPTFYTLPHSKITILIPAVYHNNSHIYDQRDAIIPDITMYQNFAEDMYLKDVVLDSIKKINISKPDFKLAQIHAIFEGHYKFSTIRNARLIKKDNSWVFKIDDLFEGELYQKDSIFFIHKHDILLKNLNPESKSFTLQIHGASLVLKKDNSIHKSIVSQIIDLEFDTLEFQLRDLQANGKLPFYLGRPFFKNKTYEIYKNHGYEKAKEFNTLSKLFFPGDPVLSIVDFELAKKEEAVFVQTGAIFSIVGKLLKRYYITITTDRIMNDQYNTFIGNYN